MNEGSNIEGTPKPGAVIAARYGLRAHLGRGRYGDVYEAFDHSPSPSGQEGRVALHVLDHRAAQQTRLLQKLEAAYRDPSSWSHANLPKVLGFGSANGSYFLAVEWLYGRSLRVLLEARGSDLALPEARALALLRGAGEALVYAHAKGAVHGDIRTAKIFITTDSVKVLDLLPASSPRATPFFVEDAAPSRVTPPDERDDVYGLACVAYELFAGRHPFADRSPLEASNAGLEPARITRISTKQWGAIERGLALRRRERTSTVAKFLAELGIPTQVPRAAPPRATPAAESTPASASATAAPVAQPEPSAQSASGSPAPLRVDPEDARRRTQISERGASRGQRVALAAVVVVAVAAAVPVYRNDQSLRLQAMRWIEKVRSLSEEPRAIAPEELPSVVAPEVANEPPAADTAVATPLVSAAVPEQAPTEADALVHGAPEQAASPELAPQQASPPQEPARTPPTPESFEFVEQVVSVSEAQAVAKVTIRRRGGTLAPSSVVWSTADGTALADSDYAGFGPTVEQFAAGETTRKIYIPIIGDTLAEGPESFYIELNGGEQRVEVVIVDDD